MYNALYRRLSSSVCKIVVELDDEVISEGSGFAFTAEGEVVTAAHVVSGRQFIKAADFIDPRVRVFVRFPGLDVVQMQPIAWGPTIVVPQFKHPVDIDLAILHPAKSMDLAMWLPIIRASPCLGDEVFMAGYSDELRLPFEVQRKLDSGVAGAPEFFRAMRRGYATDMTGPLIKRAVVGNIRQIQATSADLTVYTDVFYLDNAMHSGASGGPIVNAAGEVVGIVTQRGTTSVTHSSGPAISVPSGATVGMSLHAIDVLRTLVSRRMLPPSTE